MFRAPLTLIAVLAASPAFAQSFYRWVDAQGTTHYTDNAATIPQGVTVFATDGEPISNMGKPGPVPTPAPVAGVVPAAAQKQAEGGPTDNELYWRGQFRAARDRIRALEDEIDADARRVEAVNVGYTCAVPYTGYPVAGRQRGQAPFVYSQCFPQLNPDFDRTQRRMEKNKLALGRAKEDLHELERRAAFDAVPLEWRR